MHEIEFYFMHVQIVSILCIVSGGNFSGNSRVILGGVATLWHIAFGQV